MTTEKVLQWSFMVPGAMPNILNRFHQVDPRPSLAQFWDPLFLPPPPPHPPHITRQTSIFLTYTDRHKGHHHTQYIWLPFYLC